MSLSIGRLALEVPAIQGALSGFSDLPMRRVARAFGCVYAMNEVVLDELVVLPGKLQQQILRVADDDHPVGGQLLGATPRPSRRRRCCWWTPAMTSSTSTLVAR